MDKTLQAIQAALEASEAVRVAQQKHKHAKAAVRSTLGQEYPLSSLAGKDFIYMRAMWASPQTGVMDEETIKKYSHMEPLMLEFGKTAKQSHDRMGFEDDAIYACYVCLEQESSWNDDYPEYWEYLFVKIG